MTATLRFDVVSNGSAARRDMSATRGELEKFGKTSDKLGRQTEGTRGKLSRFGGAIGGLAVKAGPLAIAAAGAAVVKFGFDAVKAASNTQQAFGSVDAIFGRNSAKVKRWANDAATSVGLARGEYAQLAATLGATLKNSGVDNFTGKTRGLIKTAADMAATFGGSTQEAVEALGSALRGETDPIERYGVSIKQSDVNARLAALGQDKLTGAAKKSAEQQARLDLIAKQTAVSQGSFARESDTLAGQQQRLAAQFTNVKDKVGQALLPALTRGLTAVNGLFTPSAKLRNIFRAVGDVAKSYFTPVLAGLRRAVEKVRDSFDSSQGKGEGVRKILKLLGETAKVLAPIIGKTLGKALEATGTAIGLLVTGVDKLVAGFENLVEWAQKAWDKLSSLGKIPGVSKLTGLVRSGDPRLAGLARFDGGGLIGGTGGLAPVIQLESRPSVVVEIDSPALARLFRVIVRDELQRVGYSGGTVV